ncbi:MAG: hypothetical protein ABFS41_03330 [Myxococcota bacterium]
MRAIALAVLLAGAVPLAAHAAAGLRAGFGSASITPAAPDTWTDVDGDGRFTRKDRWEDGNGNGRFDAVWMAGFQNRRAAAGVHDDLEAVAVVFDDGALRVGIVAADVVGLSHGFVETVRAAYLEKLELDYLLVHSTHNHNGPDTQGIWGKSYLRSGIDDAYMETLRARMGEALAAAVAGLRPARLEIAEITGRDRRFGTVDTRGPQVIDDGLRVAILREAEGDGVLGSLVNFGNHVELLWDRNFQLTADVAGYARRGLAGGLDYDGTLHRPGLGGTTLWLTGNIGGLITTGPETGVLDVRSGESLAEPSFAKARAQGYAIAEAVLDTAADGGFAQVASPRLRVRTRELEVPVANRPLVFGTLIGVLDRDLSYGWGARTETEVALVEVGELWIVCVPGELYPEIAVGGIVNPEGADYEIEPIEVPPLRSAMRGRVNMMVNLANDALGYIIPKSEWDSRSPWLYGAEEMTYGEIVSAGPDTAPLVHKALLDLFTEP